MTRGFQTVEDELRAIIDTIPAIVARYLPDGTPDFVNQFWRDYTGLTLDDLKRKRQGAMHPDDFPTFAGLWVSNLATGTAFVFEQRLRRVDGEYRRVFGNYKPLRDEAGAIVNWYGVAFDIEDGKRAEARIRANDRELRAIIDRIPALAGRYRPDGYPDFFNQTWLDYTGLSLEDIQHNRWGVAIHPDDLATVDEEWRSHIANGNAFVMEQRLRRADGEYRWLLVHRQPFRDEEGTIINWYGVAHDIEDRKLAEIKLQAAEQNLRATVNTIPSLVWQADTSGRVEFFNDRWFEYTGCSPSQQLGWDWTSTIHPDDRTLVSDAWRRMQAGNEPLEFEARMRRFDGQYRWFLFRVEPWHDANGNIQRWYGVNTDIEDRKRAEDALRESEQRFRDFSDAASDWYWETGPDHKFTFMPEARPGFAPIAAPDRLGRTRWDLAADVDEEPAKWREHAATLEARKPFRNFTYRVRLRDGSMMHLAASGIPRFDSQGVFLGYRGGGSDVTAAVRADQAQKALRQARAELSHVTRLTTLGELTASIAHEVNQPLAGIVGNGSACFRWLEKDPPRLDEVRASVEAMVADATRAAAIIARIRALAKKAEAQKEVFDVNDLVRESILLVQRELANHNIEMKQEFGPSPAAVLGDRVQIQQVIINLIMNAIESMETVHHRPRELRIRSNSIDGVLVTVEVQDTGAGIDPKNSAKLFDAFFTTKPKGLGMGLSISRSIIDAHDGRLTAVGAEHGATFRLTLPSHRAMM
jgi:PAS domain S-box-containing protein